MYASIEDAVDAGANTVLNHCVIFVKVNILYILISVSTNSIYTNMLQCHEIIYGLEIFTFTWPFWQVQTSCLSRT